MRITDMETPRISPRKRLSDLSQSGSLRVRKWINRVKKSSELLLLWITLFELVITGSLVVYLPASQTRFVSTTAHQDLTQDGLESVLNEHGDKAACYIQNYTFEILENFVFVIDLSVADDESLVALWLCENSQCVQYGNDFDKNGSWHIALTLYKQDMTEELLYERVTLWTTEEKQILQKMHEELPSGIIRTFDIYTKAINDKMSMRLEQKISAAQQRCMEGRIKLWNAIFGSADNYFVYQLSNELGKAASRYLEHSFPFDDFSYYCFIGDEENGIDFFLRTTSYTFIIDLGFKCFVWIPTFFLFVLQVRKVMPVMRKLRKHWHALHDEMEGSNQSIQEMDII